MTDTGKHTTFLGWLKAQEQEAFSRRDGVSENTGLRARLDGMGNAFQQASVEYISRRVNGRTVPASLHRFDVVVGKLTLNENPFGKPHLEGFLWEEAEEIVASMQADPVFAPVDDWREVTEARSLPSMSYRMWTNEAENLWILIRNTDATTFVPAPLVNVINRAAKQVTRR